MPRPALDLSVYLVTDTALCGGPEAVVATVSDAVAGGVTVVQLRDPAASDAEFVALGLRLVEVLAGTGVPLIVNDRVHLVEAMGAHGAHVGQSDLSIADARAQLGPDKVLGLSVTSPEEVAAAAAAGVELDYLGAQALRPTDTKPEAGAVGLGVIAACAAASEWPVVAIGGVVASDAGDLVGAGCAGMAVVSAICGRPDAAAAARELASAWAAARGTGRRRPPVALTIAGSDPSGGAGIQADLKSFSALGAYGTSVIVALTAQSTTGVTGVFAVPADFVRLQLDTLAADVRIDAVKVGMLGTAELADAVASGLDALRVANPGLPIVVDPVMIATSGSRLLADDAVEAVRRVLQRASLATPNLPEAAALLGEPAASDLDSMIAQAIALRALGPERVLVKGGHGHPDEATDVLVDADGSVHVLRGRRVPTTNTHGTGCSLSSAIAALVPQRASWLEAVTDAKDWLTGALEHADILDIGAGPGPVHHFYRTWS